MNTKSNMRVKGETQETPLASIPPRSTAATSGSAPAPPGPGSSIVKDNRKKTPRRERLHKDWPIKVLVYPCWPIGEPPVELWDTAHEMRRLWNAFASLFRDALEADVKDEAGKPSLSKEDRAKVWAPINMNNLREVGKGWKEKLDQACRESVVNRFLKTVNNWRKNSRENGPPRFRRAAEMDTVSIPLEYNYGKSAEWLNKGEGTAGVRYTLDIKKNAPRDGNGAPLLSEEDLLAYLNNGHFSVGVSRARLDLHIAYGGRSGKKKYFLPPGCRIKAVSLCGKRDSAHGWSWSFQVRLEHPPGSSRPLTGRVCGWDAVGWRLMDGYIRIGVIADNAGHFYEVRVPLAIGELSRRVRREKAHCEKQGWEYTKPTTWDDLRELDSRYSKALDACKNEVRKTYEEEKDKWPPEARRRMGGFAKMRDSGLRRLRRKLEESDSAAKETIDNWDAEAAQLNKMIRAFEIHAAMAKRAAFRQIAAWLDAFDRVAWSAEPGLKSMAEAAGKRKQRRKEKYLETGQWEERTPEERVFENSQKFRQIVGLHNLRQFVKERHGVGCFCGDHLLQHEDNQGGCLACDCQAFNPRLMNCDAPYSTQACPECGGAIKRGHKLLLRCENGHERDQDVSQSLHLLGSIEGYTSIAAPPLDIPPHLRPYLRLMDASEAQITECARHSFRRRP